MKAFQIIFVVLVLLIVGCQFAFGFEISAYKDPISTVRLYVGPGNNTALGDCGLGHENYVRWMHNAKAGNDSVLEWYRDMGITNLCVYYANEDFSNLDGHNIKVMNGWLPMVGYRYTNGYLRPQVFAIS